MKSSQLTNKKSGTPWLHKASGYWLLTAFLVWLAYYLLPTSFWDTVYYRGVFRGIRWVFDYTLGWLPIPFAYIVIILFILRLIFILRNPRYKGGIKAQQVIAQFALLFIVFYVSWGFNYRQKPIHNVLDLPIDKFDQVDAETEFIRATQDLIVAANSLPDEFTNIATLTSHPFNDNLIRKDVERSLGLLDLPVAGRVRVRKLYPRGNLLRFGTAGIYIPHAFEGNVDPGLLAVQLPFTMAHEMAHGYGVTDEGACNFIAWLACAGSEDPLIRLGGALSYWRYAASGVSDELYKQQYQLLPPVITDVMKAISVNFDKYPDLMPRVRDFIYGTYLKSHGVPGGLKSYQYVVIMVHEYLKKRDQPSDLNRD